MLSKAYKAIAIEAIVFAATLFLAAGTIRWPAAWVFLILFFVPSVVLTRMTARLDPGLLAERMKSPLQKGQPSWDKIWLPSMLILTYVWLIVMGLDAVRFRWSVVPLWLQAIGGAAVPALVLGMVVGVSREHICRGGRESSVGARAQGRLDRPLCRRETSGVRDRLVDAAGVGAFARLVGGIRLGDDARRDDRFPHGDGGSRASPPTRRLSGVRGARSLSAGADDLVKTAHHLAAISKTIAPASKGKAARRMSRAASCRRGSNYIRRPPRPDWWCGRNERRRRPRRPSERVRDRRRPREEPTS